MKLRQKLAVVLASAMVVSAVPVVTMATATTSTKREVITIEKDKAFMTTATANAVKVNFDNEAIEDGATEVIYLSLENAEWNEDAFDAAVNNFTRVTGTDLPTWTGELAGSKAGSKVGVKFVKQDEKVMQATLTLKLEDPANAGTYLYDAKDSTFYLPLLVTAKGGDAKVTVENKGNGSLAKKNSFIFATTGEKKFSVAAGEVKTFYRKGELSKLVITEAFPGSLKNGGQFRIELDDTDFKFDGTVEAKGMYGFGGKSVSVTLAPVNGDASAALVTIGAVQGDGSLGVIELTGIKVSTNNKTPDEGDFLVDIKKVDDSMADDVNNLVLGKVAKYSTYIKMKDDKAVEVKAGRVEEIEFSIGEGVEDSMISDREFEVKLDNAHFEYAKLTKEYYEEKAKGTSKTALQLAKEDYSKATFEANTDECKKTAAHIDSKWLAKKLVKDINKWGNTTVEFDTDSDNMIDPTTLIVTLDKFTDTNVSGALQSNNNMDEITLIANACVSIEDKEKEKVTIKASGRALENEISTTAITIVNPFNVTYEQAHLKVGLQGQVSGSLKLTETDKDMFQKGDITFTIKDADENKVGIYLTDVEFETSAGIKGEKTKEDKTNKSATVTLNRVTKEAGSIEFKNMKFTADRTVPEGTYDLEISGKGIDADGHTLVIKDFIKITTTNTEDITANGLAKGTSTFVIGESKYIVNGEERTMDAKSYIKDPGYTMVPVRYVAEAFGVTKENILFANGSATIFAGTRTIQLTNGSNIAVVNGAKITMATAVEIKDGRTYAPIGEIATILGIAKEWTPETKTATFINK